MLAAAEVAHHQQQQSPSTKFFVGGGRGSPSPTTNKNAFSPPLHSLRSPHHASSISPHGNSRTTTNAGTSIVRLPQYTPDSRKFAAAMVAAVSSPAPLSPSKKHHPVGLVNTAINGTPGGPNSGFSRVGADAHYRSIQEAGVGPMAPLVDDTRSDSGSVSPYANEMDRDGRRKGIPDEDDDTDATVTAPEAEGDDDYITRCICDFLHDDGYMICCDKCL